MRNITRTKPKLIRSLSPRIKRVRTATSQGLKQLYDQLNSFEKEDWSQLEKEIKRKEQIKSSIKTSKLPSLEHGLRCLSPVTRTTKLTKVPHLKQRTDKRLLNVLENIHVTIHKEAIRKVRETKM